MKNFKPAALICLVLFGIMLSCVKNTARIEYAASISNRNLVPLNPVKKGEPFVIFPLLPDSNATVRWTIRPSDSTQLSTNGNQVTISIFLAGSYVITANFYAPSNTVSPYDSSIYTIIVNDSVYTPQVRSEYDTVLLNGKEITLVPISISGTLEVIAKTAIKYNCTSYITAIGFFQGTNTPQTTIVFFFDSARIAISNADCGGVKNSATISIRLDSLANGFHPIYVELNRILYQGSVDVTDSNYTFTWPYSSGAIISPLQIKK
jgi:hypothetical protein